MIPCTIIPGKSLTFFLNGRPQTFDGSHPNFQKIVDAVTANDLNALETLTNVRQFVAKVTEGNVVITEDSEVLFRGVEVPEYLAERIISHHEAGIPILPLCNFAEKLMSNTNASVRNDLYRWLEVGNMPVYEDGDFMAYKTVRSDFTPVHKGPYGKSQKPGEVVEMPRSECDENRENTCSRGLHFCSYSYLPSFGYGNEGQTVIVLKINPKDVTSIPTDYNNAKGRCCRFEVVSEILSDKIVPANLEGEKVVTKKKVSEKSESNFSTTSGVTLSAKQILSAVKTHGSVSKAAKALGVARSTMHGWAKKLGIAEK